jgi:hypothetical protein
MVKYVLTSNQLEKSDGIKDLPCTIRKSHDKDEPKPNFYSLQTRQLTIC